MRMIKVHNFYILNYFCLKIIVQKISFPTLVSIIKLNLALSFNPTPINFVIESHDIFRWLCYWFSI